MLSQSSETGNRVLTLPEVIQLAREQSLMALMARHQFRSSYWEYRTHMARYRPGLTLEATFPSLNNVMESVTQPDGSEKFVSTSNMQTSLDLQLNQNIGLTGGRVFVTSQLQRNDNFGEEPPTTYLAYPVTIGFMQPINGYNALKWDRKIEPMKYEEAKLEYINTMERVSQQGCGIFFRPGPGPDQPGDCQKEFCQYRYPLSDCHRDDTSWAPLQKMSCCRWS